MMIGKRTHLRMIAGGVLAVGLLCWFALTILPESEPVWDGYPLSTWLAAYDSKWRFEAGDSRRSAFSDEQIDRALAGLCPEALPTLLVWLKAKPSPWKQWSNRQLGRLPYIRFCFRDEAASQPGLAEIGFTVYGVRAQPVLPELIRLTQSRDVQMRVLAFEAAFFTRPDKAAFLSLAERALKDPDEDIQEMAAGWMVERFPDEAEKAGLRKRFPIFYEDQSAMNETNRP